MAAQANNLTIFNVVLAVSLFLLAVTWGSYVKRRAERMAKEAADKWMDANAPSVVAELLSQMTTGPSSGPQDQGDALQNDPVKGDGK